MTHRLALFQYGLVGLVVPATVDGVFQAANVQVVLRHVEMFLISRRPIELHAVDGIAFASRKRRIVNFEVFVECVGSLDGLIQQVPFACRVIVSSRNFEVGVPPPGLRHQRPNPPLHLRFKCRIRMRLKRCDRGFEHIHAELPLGLLEFLGFKRNRHFSIGLDLWSPEMILERYVGAELRTYRVVANWRVRRRSDSYAGLFRLLSVRAREETRIRRSAGRRRRFQKTTAIYSLAHQTNPRDGISSWFIFLMSITSFIAQPFE